MKRAQVTLFFFLGAFIVIMITLVLYLAGNYESKGSGLEFDTTGINSYMSECIGTISEPAVIAIGKRGGTLYPTRAISTINGMIGIPLKIETQTAEEDLKEYIEKNSIQCLYALQEKWQAEAEEATAEVVFAKETIDIYVKMPVKVTHKNKVLTSEDFFYKHNIRLRQMMEDSQTILESYYSTNKWLDLDEIARLNETITAYQYKNITVVSLADGKSRTKKGDYRFTFGLH